MKLSVVHTPIFYKKGTISSGIVYYTSVGSVGGWVQIRGQGRIEGLIMMGHAADPSAGVTPGFPRIEFSDDGVNPNRYVVIPQDPTPDQPGFVYPVDVRCTARYARVAISYTDGAAPTTQLDAQVYARPDSGGPPS